MHPGERNGDDQEEQHEATRPDAGEIGHDTEGDRQDEAAEAADHADQAADRADMARIVDRDVLVDRRLAERHEEAENENGEDEGNQVHLRREGDRSLDAVDDVVGLRVGQHEQADQRHDERPVHDRAGAVAVRKVSAVGPEKARRDRVERREHAGGLDAEAVDVDQVVGQPQRQGDEAAEDEEIIQREAPDLLMAERLEVEQDRAGLLAACPPGDEFGIVVGGEPEDDRHDRQGRRPDHRDGLPAEGDEDEGREELGDRRADVADTEYPQRRPLPVGREPPGDVGDADRERAAGEADAEGGDEHPHVGLGEGEEEGRGRSGEHRHRVDEAAAILIGPDTEKDADERPGQDRQADEKPELGLAEPEILFDPDADDRKDRPDREADGEGDRRKPQRPLLAAGRVRHHSPLGNGNHVVVAGPPIAIGAASSA